MTEQQARTNADAIFAAYGDPDLSLVSVGTDPTYGYVVNVLRANRPVRMIPNQATADLFLKQVQRGGQR